jgi:L-ascorbate metabolism protein UlaG (beta-lactamase superfamily)
MAAEIAGALDPAWVVPMHYRTPRIGFFESEEEFVAAMAPRVERMDGPGFDTETLGSRGDGPVAVIPAAP